MQTSYAVPARIGAATIAAWLLAVSASFGAGALRERPRDAGPSQRALQPSAPRPILVDAPAAVVAKAGNVARPKNVCATVYYGGLEELAQQGCKTYYDDPTHGYPECADGK